MQQCSHFLPYFSARSPVRPESQVLVERQGWGEGEAHSQPQGNFREGFFCGQSYSSSWGEVNQARYRSSWISRIAFFQNASIPHAYKRPPRYPSWAVRGGLCCFLDTLLIILFFCDIIRDPFLLTPILKPRGGSAKNSGFSTSLLLRWKGQSSPHWVRLSLCFHSVPNFKH